MQKAGLRALITAIGVTVACAAAAAAPPADEYGGWPEIWGRRTGFFHLEQIRSRWWLVTPAGNAFLAKTIEVAAPPPAHTAAQVRANLADWGFSSIGPRVSPNLAGAGIPYLLLLDLSRSAVAAGVVASGRRTDDGSERAFPDVFDPRFEPMVKQAAEICAARADDPWLIGYFTDEGLAWRPHGGDLADAFLALPPGAPGKQALADELRRRHDGQVERFNAAWDLRLESWQELLEAPALRPGPRFDGYQVSADRSALVSLIAGRYFEVVSRAVRAHDPNHLLLGCRFTAPPGREVAAAMRGHMDAASLTWTGEQGADLLVRMHSDSGLPLLVSAAAQAADPAEVANPQHLRAAQVLAYQADVEALARQAFVVAHAWPRYASLQAAGPEHTGGLVDPEGEPYPAVVARVKRANDRFYTQASLAALKPTLFDIVERYELRRAPAPVSVDGDLKDWAGAQPMRLRPGSYDQADRVEATAYIMWDAGAVYVAGRVLDPAAESNTVTSFVGADWLELAAGPYHFRLTLRPGAQTVTDQRGRSREAALALGRIMADADAAARRVIGYTFEGRVDVSGMIPQGFMFRFGLALHRYSPDGRAVTLSHPHYWSPDNPASGADIIVIGPGSR